MNICSPFKLRLHDALLSVERFSAYFLDPVDFLDTAFTVNQQLEQVIPLMGSIYLSDTIRKLNGKHCMNEGDPNHQKSGSVENNILNSKITFVFLIHSLPCHING